jgi:putative sterol carrier protein
LIEERDKQKSTQPEGFSLTSLKNQFVETRSDNIMGDDKLIFPSEEWIQEYVKKLNSNKAYEDAAATWEGDFVFEVYADDEFIEEPIYFYLDLWHGKCREARMAGPDDKAEFIYAAPYKNWKLIMEGKLDPIKALMSRKAKLTGDMGKVMRATKAAAELVNTASMLDTKYIDE